MGVVGLTGVAAAGVQGSRVPRAGEQAGKDGWTRRAREPNATSRAAGRQGRPDPAGKGAECHEQGSRQARTAGPGVQGSGCGLSGRSVL